MVKVKQPKAPDKQMEGVDAQANQLDFGDLWSRVVYLILRMRAESWQLFAEIMEGSGIAAGQFNILYLISLNRGCTQISLANAAGLDRSTMAPIVDRFEKSGWVRRTRRDNNRRAYFLELTETGREVVAAATPLVNLHEQELTRGLSAEEKKTLLKLLIKTFEGCSGEKVPFNPG